MTLSAELASVPVHHLIPHRPPFLFVDKALDLTPFQSGTFIKNITANEPALVGHFPEQPIFPGVLLIETAAQSVALLLALSDRATKPPGEITKMAPGCLTRADFKFVRKVKPGDQVKIMVRILQMRPGYVQAEVDLMAGNDLVATGKLSGTV